MVSVLMTFSWGSMNFVSLGVSREMLRDVVACTLASMWPQLGACLPNNMYGSAQETNNYNCNGNGYNCNSPKNAIVIAMFN
eukprot:4158108-Amphidinium_carterae.1